MCEFFNPSPPHLYAHSLFLLPYRVEFAVFAQDFRSDPALGPWHTGAPAEAVPARCQLLAQAEV